MTSGDETSSTSFGCSTKNFNETSHHHHRRRLTVNEDDDDDDDSAIAENSSFFVGGVKNEEENKKTIVSSSSSMNSPNCLRKDLFDEDVIDGFAFISFESAEELKEQFKCDEQQPTDAAVVCGDKSNNNNNNNNEDNKDKQRKQRKKKDNNKSLRVNNNNIVMTEINGDKTEAENSEVIVSSTTTTTATAVSKDCLNAVEVKISNNNRHNHTSITSTNVINKDASTSITPIQQQQQSCFVDNKNGNNDGTRPSSIEISGCSVEGLENNNKLNGAGVKHKLQIDDNNDADAVIKNNKCPKLSVDQETQVGIPSRVLSPNTAHGSLTNGLPCSILNSFSKTTVKKENSINCADTPSIVVQNGSATNNFDRKSSSGGLINANFSVGNVVLNSPATEIATTSSSSSSYFHTEMHQHQHTHMHHYPPQILPPFAVNTPVNGPLFGLAPCTPNLPPLPIIPPSTIRNVVPSISTPNFQPQTPRKKGRWCALHVQIAWDIHNNRTKVKKDKPPPSSASLVDYCSSSTPCTSSATAAMSKSACFPSVSEQARLALPLTASNSLSNKPKQSANVVEAQTKNAGRTSQESKTEIRTATRNEREKHTNSVRSESRASGGSSSVGSAALSCHEKERQPSLVNNNLPPVADDVVVSRNSISTQDGLLYRQKELQERLQAQSLAALSSIRSGLPPPPTFPPMISQDSMMIPNMAAIQSQLNLLHGTSPADLYHRLRLSAPSGLDSYRGNAAAVANGLGGGQVRPSGPGGPSLQLSDAPFRPPSNGLLTIDNDRNSQLQKQVNLHMMQQQQQQQRLQQQQQQQHQHQQQQSQAQATYVNANGTSIGNPLASLIDSERALNRSLTLIPPGFPPIPGLFNGLDHGTGAGVPFVDSPGALALYSSLIQRERLELEQRSRMLGLMGPPHPQSLMAAAGGPSAAEIVERLSGMYPASVMFPRVPQPPPPSLNGQYPSHLNLNGAAALGLSFSQGSTNKLNESPFSLTLQQLARRGGDVFMNSGSGSMPSTTHNNNNLKNS